MQKLAEVCIRRPVFAAMLILALVVVGAASYARLGVDRFPRVDLPTITIRTTLPGASPAEVEAQLAQPIEQAVNTVEGIKELRSISGPGSSFVIVSFNLNRDIDSAAQDVRDRIATVLRDLPRESDPPVVSKMDNDTSPIMTVALVGERSIRELTELADKVVKVQLERAPGVGAVDVLGGLERAINVWVDAERLAAFQVPITAVREAISRQNADVPGGNVTAGAREFNLRTLGRLTNSAAFNDLVVATVNGVPVRIRDIGWAEDGTREARTLSRLNGVPNVSLDIRRQSDANTVAVIQGIKERLDTLQDLLPPDVRLEVIRDQSRYIEEALHEIQTHLVLGSALACLVVLLFMRSWRATIIAGVAIPASIIATFGMMWALNFTLNSVTMLALVLMVGIVIDDAIVVLENIHRFVEEKGLNPFEAARQGTAEISLAVLATTLSLVVIFVPVSFMSSVSGRFLFQFGITSAVAVLVSLLVSFTLTPMMSARLLRASGSRGQPDVTSRRGFYGRLDRAYDRALRFAMRHRLLVVIGAAAVALLAIPLYRLVPQEYIPGNVDEGEFDVSVNAPQEASLSTMDEVTRLMEKELAEIPGITLVQAAVGGFGSSINSTRAYVRITPHEDRVFSLGRLWRETWRGQPLAAFKNNFSQRDVMQEVRKRLKKYPDLRISVRNARSFNIGGSPSEIDFSILGPDLARLADYAEELRRIAPEIGVIDADVTLRLDTPELQVVIDRARAATLGVEISDIAQALRIMVGGDQKVSRFRDPGVNEDYYVQLRLAAADRNDPSTISRLYVPRRDGGLVRLDNLVQVVPAETASRIDRLDRQRQASLRGSVGPGYALADRLQALKKAAADLNMPAGYTTRVSGRGRELETTFQEFLWAMALSILFMYMILAANYESLVHPFTILLSLPLALPFALFSLWATGNTLNLYSALGLLVLFGVVKKNAILQIDHMNHLRALGMERSAAILLGNRNRLRPILMTTFTLVAGMIPLAVGSGPGAEERRAIAVVVIGGQTLCLLLTLLVTPVVYSYLDDWGQRLHWRQWTRRLRPGPTVHTATTPAATVPTVARRDDASFKRTNV